MDKLTVSQCVTADWCRGYNAAVEKANEEINEMKKHNEQLKRFLKSKIKVKPKYVIDYGAYRDYTDCLECKYHVWSEDEFPCKKCVRGVKPSLLDGTEKDYWTLING